LLSSLLGRLLIHRPGAWADAGMMSAASPGQTYQGHRQVTIEEHSDAPDAEGRRRLAQGKCVLVA
jgi:hypothetical protein